MGDSISWLVTHTFEGKVNHENPSSFVILKYTVLIEFWAFLPANPLYYSAAADWRIKSPSSLQRSGHLT